MFTKKNGNFWKIIRQDIKFSSANFGTLNKSWTFNIIALDANLINLGQIWQISHFFATLFNFKSIFKKFDQNFAKFTANDVT